MKINVLGGGPAGLYAAILLAKDHSGADISVYERNAPDDTFGWGVVFSDETLGNLREADGPTFDAIQENFIYWDAIELIHDRGDQGTHRARSGGHGFCGIGRRQLLLLLQERAKALGVTLRFSTEVESIDALRDADLVIAADGVSSKTRDAYADAFLPTVTMGKSRFIWLGTDRLHEAFTFIFRENEHGTFQVHAYQFDDHTSTFIVECDEETFARTGLGVHDEEAAIAYCQALFGPELGAHKLLGNRSWWRLFPEVVCQRWTHENMVLLGDAAHTAHFSVGSGTKLAMEDAITLAEVMREAFAGRQAEADGSIDTKAAVAQALAAYDGQRHDMVARTQRAASQSQAWFEQSPRHLQHDTERLMFSLLSRTRRVTLDNLRLREAAYADRVTRHFQNQGDGAPSPIAAPVEGDLLPPMFRPYDLAGLPLTNRVVVSPMCQYRATDGMPGPWHQVHLGSRAIGGAGLVFTEMTNVSADGRITPGCTGLYNDAQEAAWKGIVDFIHAESNGKLFVQLGHAGPKGACKLPFEVGYDVPLDAAEAWPLWGPSPLAWAPENQVPRPMDEGAMAQVTQDFVAAAERAARAGFDGVEVHLAHGYLLSAFLSPLSNQRDDAFGGSLENRARFPLQVVRAVRAAWEGPLSVRISATDWVDGAFDIDDAVQLASWLRDAGVDLIDVSAGQTSTKAKPVYGRAFQTPFAERIRNEVGIATMAVGNILDADRVNTILAAGRADLVALARAHLADPYFVRRAAAAQGVVLPWPDPYAAAATVDTRMFGPS